MEIKVPNLVSESALAFCAELEQIVDIEDDVCYVDFQNLNTSRKQILRKCYPVVRCVYHKMTPFYDNFTTDEGKKEQK